MRKLENIEKQNNFKVPEGYFENFESTLNARINFEVSHSNYKNTFQIFKTYIYLAACILVLVVGVRILVDKTVDNSEIDTYEAKRVEYIEDVIAEFCNDRLLFYEYFEELSKTTENNSTLSNTDYIEDYLLQYNIEDELFYE